jgi:holin-like protein
VAILTGFLLVGTALHRVGVPIPGGVLGLIFFYLSLSSGLVKISWVESASAFLLRHMLLLFIPITLGLMDLAPMLKHEALPLTVSLVVSLIAVQVVTGLLAKSLLRRPDVD